MKKIVLILLLCYNVIFAQYNPHYRTNVEQKLLDLSNDYVILNINFKPSDEDITALTKLRFEDGYKIFNLFFTRGECEQTKYGDLFGPELAVALSKSANEVAKIFDLENYFLNYKTNKLLPTKEDILESWGGFDSSSIVFNKLLNIIKPDIILINNEFNQNKKQYKPYYEAITEVTINAVEVYNSKSDIDSTVESHKIGKVYSRVNKKDKEDIELSIKKLKTFSKLKESFVKEYSNLLEGISQSKQNITSYYNMIYSESKIKKGNSFKSGIVLKFRESSQINIITDNIIKQRNIKKESLLLVLQKTDEVLDILKRVTKPSEVLRNRVLSKIKYDISELRFHMLNPKIDKYLSDSIICPRQVFEFKIDSIYSKKKGVSMIMFYGIEDTSWLLMRGNNIGKNYQINFNEPFVFVSPEILPLSYPREEFQYYFFNDDPLFYYVILFYAEDPLYNFQYFGDEYLGVVDRANFQIIPKNQYIDKTAEIEYTLEHFLNDPFKNIMPNIIETDTYKGTFTATSSSVSKKYDKAKGKIEFIISDSLNDGNYPVTFMISEPFASTIIFKKFELLPKEKLTVALFSKDTTILSHYLKSVGFDFLINPSKADVSLCDAFIVDENYLKHLTKELNSKLLSEIQKGKNFIVLNQSMEIVDLFGNKIFNKQTDFAYTTDKLIIEDSKIFSYPNLISESDLNNWDYEISRDIPDKFDNEFHSLIKINTPNIILGAGLLHKKEKQGNIFYLPLSIKKQLFTVNEAIYKLLNNLIIYKDE
jgi:hypothetical protein